MIEASISQKALHASTLKLHPEGLYTRYGCMITFEEKQKKQELRYKLDIKYIGKSEANHNLFRLERSTAVYINDKLPDTSTEELAAQISQVIYPLELETKANGAFYRVVNFEAIQSRWQQVKTDVKSYYKGDVVDKYIALHDAPLTYPDVFNAKIAQDWFIHVFFSKLYLNYTARLSFESKEGYYVAGHAGKVNYDTVKTIEDNPSGPSHFVTIKGAINDERCALDLEQELTFPYYASNFPDEKQPQLKGSCDIMYAIHKETGVVTGIEGIFDTQFMSPKKVTVKMFALDPLKEKNTVFIEEGQKEQGFWARFFKKSNKS